MLKWSLNFFWLLLLLLLRLKINRSELKEKERICSRKSFFQIDFENEPNSHCNLEIASLRKEKKSAFIFLDNSLSFLYVFHYSIIIMNCIFEFNRERERILS